MYTLSRQEVRDAIEGKKAPKRPPMFYDFWIYNNVFGGDETKREEWLSQYPRDIQTIYLNMPGLLEGPKDAPDYRWTGADIQEDSHKGFDARILIPDWESREAECFFETFPDADYPGLIPAGIVSDGRYMVAQWWYTLFERHWSLRGMEEALTDFYIYPEETHRLYQRLTDFYVRIVERTCKTLGVDGFFVSDDLGTQNSTFFSVDIFREFFKPYYKQIIDKAHEYGAHFWLHSCGNIEAFLPQFIDIGLDVIHPIQKYTMNERRISQLYGDKICIMSGFDVQQTIPFGTPEEVRREIRSMLDVFYREDGRLMLTMGNGSTEDWSLESLKALYEEALSYGLEKGRKNK